MVSTSYKAILENGNFSSISSLVSIGNGVDDICKSQQVEDEVSREISCLDSDKLIGLIPPVMHSKLPVNDEQSSQNLTTDNVLQVRNDTDLLQSTKRILEKTGDRLSTQLKSSGLRTGKNTHHIYSSQRKTASYLNNLSPENDNLMDFIHLVVPEGKSSNEPQESNCSSDTQSYSSDENDNSVNESEVNLETREPLLKSTGSNSDDEANVPKSSVDDEKKKLGFKCLTHLFAITTRLVVAERETSVLLCIQKFVVVLTLLMAGVLTVTTVIFGMIHLLNQMSV
ncbi:unnamed protein product [Heterobilharzia americana]|nr:unnamed protein product [Heterobilharzia americana]